MAKIVLFLPGNATHSFLIGERWQKMYNERLGLEAIGKSGVPVTVSHQGLDYELYPFLRDMHSQYSNIDVANAPFGHSLLPFCGTSQKRWETRRVLGNLPVTFFSEFYSPSADFIPTEFFFYLKKQTYSYSMVVIRRSSEVFEPEIDTPLDEKIISVKYGNKIGIVMDGFEGFLKHWFAFAQNPSVQNIANLIDEVKKLVHDPRSVVVIPLDLEQPYVGSVEGEKLWTLFFDAIKKEGLDEHIVSLRSVLDEFRRNPIAIKQPHRILTKWTVHALQLNYMFKLNGMSPRTEKERMIYSLAASSDIFSSWGRYVGSLNKKPVEIVCTSLNGWNVTMSQGHNQLLQDGILAAFNALKHGDTSLVLKLEKLQCAGLVLGLAKWAKNKGL